MRYRAFISYSHADARWARWLIRRLEGYKVPSRLVGTVGDHGVIGPTLGAFFRDREELTASGDLGATIRAALAESDALVLVCSPAAARSRWVNAEVETFRANGRGDRVLCFLVDGEPGSTEEATACFPSAMRSVDANGDPVEPLAADARPYADGRENALLKLIAGLLGVRYDVLAQREAQRRQKRLLAITAASLAGMAVAIGLAATAVVARNDAQRRQAQAEDIVGFMLGDLRTKLTTVGRLDLMRSVDDKATGYFATLNPRDLSDRALQEQARSLTGIGQVRLDEGSHAEALAAFQEAHSRSSALFARAQHDGQRLFDLAQAEYWIGFVAFQQGRHDDAGVWFRRYRDSAIGLSTMDPSNFDWQREIAYGHHNLAVLDERLGRYAEAERAMREVLELFRRWVENSPTDTSLRSEWANATSWLGSLAMRQGRLVEAEALFADEVGGYATNRELEPRNVGWTKDWIVSRILLSDAEAARGRLAEASVGIEQAAGLAQGLIRHDPANQSWQLLLGKILVWRARLDGNAARGEATALAAERIFANAVAATPTNESSLLWLGKNRNLLGEFALARNDNAAAQHWLIRSRDALQPAWRERPSELLRVVHASTQVLLGRADYGAGNAAAAREAWHRAERLLREDGGAVLPFERLDPLVRTLTHLGRTQEAQPHLQRLIAAGYQPLPAWPPPPSDPIAAGH